MKKSTLFIDAFLLLSLAVVFFFFIFSIRGSTEEGDTGLLLSPPTSVLFEFPQTDYVLIGNDLDFDNARKINLENRLVLEFSQGTYYLEIPLQNRNDIRRFTVNNGKIRLMFLLDEPNAMYSVVSVSEPELEVDVSYYGDSRGKLILENSGLEGGETKRIGGNNG